MAAIVGASAAISAQEGSGGGHGLQGRSGGSIVAGAGSSGHPHHRLDLDGLAGPAVSLASQSAPKCR